MLGAPIVLALAAALVLSGRRARAADDPDDGSAPDHLAEVYRRAGLPPYLERRVQAVLEAEWRAAHAHADQVGLRRMSRSHYRRALAALDRSTEAKIRALVGAKRFLAWNRARTDLPTGAGWTRDRCAGLGRLLRGPALASMTVEEAHFWIHDHARHC